ncbi:MAG: DUF4412 domain-containing protein [Candidatus Eisenbacteria bacterium]|nr:DUF4412 domain-containing protein [Candidatus Eisenbacteria bacterium]
MKLRWLLLPVLLGALLGGEARADVTIETKHNEETHMMYLAEHMFRSDIKDGMVIFRGDKKVLWMVDLGKKKYTEMTEADAKAMGQKIDEAMARMQEALKEASPEQRAMMEKMMGNVPGAKQKSKRIVTPLGQSREINGFRCKGYTVDTGDEATSEVWATDPKAINLDPAELSVFKEFAEFMQEILPGMDSLEELMKDYENPGEDQVPGFPILTIAKDKKGKESWRSEVVRLEKGSIGAEKFEVPAGWKKEKGAFGE